MSLQFRGEVWYWRGPSPFHFITVPDAQCQELAAASPVVSYGWGVIPVTVQIGATRFTTSLFPKNGGYIVPVKAAVRAAEGIELGDTVTVRMTIGA